MGAAIGLFFGLFATAGFGLIYLTFKQQVIIRKLEQDGILTNGIHICSNVISNVITQLQSTLTTYSLGLFLFFVCMDINSCNFKQTH